MYYVGQESTIFNWKNYFIWVITGVCHSIIVFVFPFYAYEYSILQGRNGWETDLWTFSVTSFTSIILVTNITIIFINFYTIGCDIKINGLLEALDRLQFHLLLCPQSGCVRSLHLGHQLHVLLKDLCVDCSTPRVLPLLADCPFDCRTVL
jgi:magnesium-transporting ATPase (P-type)